MGYREQLMKETALIFPTGNPERLSQYVVMAPYVENGKVAWRQLHETHLNSMEAARKVAKDHGFGYVLTVASHSPSTM